MEFMNSILSKIKRDKRRAKLLPSLLTLIMILSSPIILSGCSGGDVPPASPGSNYIPPPDNSSNTIALAISQNSVQSDGSDSATVTATVIKNNVPQEGTTVNFSTTVGLISSGSETTDSNGEAIITFKANLADRANQLATITASSTGISSQSIPITIDGTTVNLTPEKSSLMVGETTTLTIQVEDAGNIGINGATVQLRALNNHVTLSSSIGTTINGTLEVQVSGASIGTAEVEASSLGATKTITMNVIEASTAISITSPSKVTPVVILTNTNQTVTVSGIEGTELTFVTTLGTWSNGLKTESKTIIGGTATATLNSSAVGTTTIQVYDINNPTNSDSIFITISPPKTQARQVAISLSSISIAPSTASVKNSVSVFAKVLTSTGEPIANVPVTFSLSNTTGGGEYVSPSQVQTDGSGYATVMFYSGTSSSSGFGVNITATEQGSGLGNSDTKSVIIGGTAASITLSAGTKIISSPDNTYYILPMSVIVTDSSGAAVSNATVSLSTWPIHYYLGFHSPDGPIREPIPGTIDTYAIANEDVNRNLILDAGEDVGPCSEKSACTALVPDHQLTPPSATAGSVPSTITTIENGTGSFELTYLKSSAGWIDSEITASVRVLGTESKYTLVVELGYLIGEEGSLPNSPYGYY